MSDRLPNANELLPLAQTALLAAGGVSISRQKLITGHFDFDGETWFVCRGAQVKSAANLLDRTVALRRKDRQVRKAVCILDPPDPLPGRDLAPGLDYLHRHQGAAWYGLSIVEIVFDGHNNPLPWKPVVPVCGAQFDQIAQSIDAQLKTDRGSWTPFEDSREAEGLVLPAVHRALASHGFRRDLPEEQQRVGSGKSFPALWRKAVADGMWIRDQGIPKRIALEVKWEEDAGAPLSQVIDDLGVADAVVQVRLVRGRPVVRDDLIELEGKLPLKFLLVTGVDPRQPNVDVEGAANCGPPTDLTDQPGAHIGG